MSRLSGPLLDRIDLHITMKPYEPLTYMTEPTPENTATVAQRVLKARNYQKERQGNINALAIIDNLDLSPAAQEMAQKIAKRFRLSARGYTRLVRVARTIADLAAIPTIEPAHIAEAATFRLRYS